MEGSERHLDPILDGDEAATRAELVHLIEIVRGPLKCDYAVVGGRTKYQLFAVGGRFVPDFGEILKTSARKLFGDDAKVEWVRELDSWYVEVPRTMADGGGSGAEKLMGDLLEVHADR